MKKILSAMLASTMALSLAAVGVFAAQEHDLAPVTGMSVVDADGEPYAAADVTYTAGSLTMENVTPSSTIYIPVYDGSSAYDNVSDYYAKDFRDSKLYSFRVSKEENGSLIDSIEYVSQKNLGNYTGRPDWIKVVLKDSTMTSEEKFEGTVTFKARKSSDPAENLYTPANVASGDTVTLDLNLWINNEKVEGSDASADTGDRFYFEPDKNETNVLIWGDDRAALEFDADDDGATFYARLSVKSDGGIYREYGDPANADLYFYDFVGSPTIPSTARATLTLGVPWEEDDNAPDPLGCYIYQVDEDGRLTDVTDQFTYSEDEEEIPGWTTRTRTLGSYVLSDVELDVEVAGAEESEPSQEDDKEIPDTGRGGIPLF